MADNDKPVRLSGTSLLRFPLSTHMGRTLVVFNNRYYASLADASDERCRSLRQIVLMTGSAAIKAAAISTPLMFPEPK